MPPRATRKDKGTTRPPKGIFGDDNRAIDHFGQSNDDDVESPEQVDEGALEAAAMDHNARQRVFKGAGAGGFVESVQYLGSIYSGEVAPKAPEALKAIAGVVIGTAKTVMGLNEYMVNLKKNNGAVGDDMINSDATMRSLGADSTAESYYYGAQEETKSESGNTENSFIEVFAEAAGIPLDEAAAVAAAVDINKDDNITDKEMDKYASSQNSVFDRIIKDPRFRNRLVKRRPYQSIYGDNYSSEYNQTDIAEQGAALDNDSYNVSNVVYDD